LLAGSPALAADEVVLIEEGQPAPFAGSLYSTERAIRVSAKAERCEFVIAEEKKKADRLIEEKQDTCTKKLAVDKEAHELKEKILKDKPAEWWQLGLAYLAGVATVAVAAWAIGQANK
jgi:hypothetical protein